MNNYLRRLWRALWGQDHELEDVRAFHVKFGQLAYDEPGFLTPRKLKERLDFLAEELKELRDSRTLADQADALVDLVYVAKGTAVAMGLPWAALWDDVQRANLAKVVGTTHRGNLVDVMKPPGWKAPQGAQILDRYGWDWGDATTKDLMAQPTRYLLRDDQVHKHSGEAYGVPMELISITEWGQP